MTQKVKAFVAIPENLGPITKQNNNSHCWKRELFPTIVRAVAHASHIYTYA